MTVVQDHLKGTTSAQALSREPALRSPWGTRLLGLTLVGCAVVLVLWLLALATSLPTATEVQQWSAMWVGLDALEALGLASTGVLLLRGDPHRFLTAAGTAALLIVDAWIDVLTSLPGSELGASLAMAVGVELPLATLCVVIAVRAVPRAEAVRHNGAARIV